MDSSRSWIGFRFLAKLPLFYVWLWVFAFQMGVYLSDRLAWKLLRYDKRSRYLRQGHCARTGMCCQNLAVELPASWVRRPWLLKFFQRWYAQVHNFQSTGPPQGKLLPLTCGHLRQGNLCSIYPYRRKLCREYPSVSVLGYVELH